MNQQTLLNAETLTRLTNNLANFNSYPKIKLDGKDPYEEMVKR